MSRVVRFGRPVKRGDQELTLGVHVGPALDQQLSDRSVAGVGRRVQGREAAGVTPVDRGALLDEKPGDRIVAGQDRENQRRLATIAPRADRRPLGDRRASLLEVAVARGVMERLSID